LDSFDVKAALGEINGPVDNFHAIYKKTVYSSKRRGR